MDRVIDKTPDRIAGMFDAIAGRYDLLKEIAFEYAFILDALAGSSDA